MVDRPAHFSPNPYSARAASFFWQLRCRARDFFRAWVRLFDLAPQLGEALRRVRRARVRSFESFVIMS